MLCFDEVHHFFPLLQNLIDTDLIGQILHIIEFFFDYVVLFVWNGIAFKEVYILLQKVDDGLESVGLQIHLEGFLWLKNVR